MIPWLTSSSRVRRCWSFNCSTAGQQREGKEGNPSVQETTENTFSGASCFPLWMPRQQQAAEMKTAHLPARSPAPLQLQKWLSAVRFPYSAVGNGEEVAQGLGRVIKILKAGPVSQFFLQHQLLSKPLR